MEPLWRYLDEDNMVQGPFTCRQMCDWFRGGYLAEALLVCGTERKVSPPNLPHAAQYVPLGALLSMVQQQGRFTPLTLQDVVDFKPGPMPAPPAGGDDMAKSAERGALEEEGGQAREGGGDGDAEPPARQGPARDGAARQPEQAPGGAPAPLLHDAVDPAALPLSGTAPPPAPPHAHPDAQPDVPAAAPAPVQSEAQPRSLAAASSMSLASAASAVSWADVMDTADDAAESSAADGDRAVVSLADGAPWGAAEPPEWWYYDASGRLRGPAAGARFAELWRGGVVGRDTPVCAAERQPGPAQQPRKALFYPLSRLLAAVGSGGDGLELPPLYVAGAPLPPGSGHSQGHRRGGGGRRRK